MVLFQALKKIQHHNKSGPEVNIVTNILFDSNNFLSMGEFRSHLCIIRLDFNYLLGLKIASKHI